MQENQPSNVQTFNDMGLPSIILSSLERLKFSTPTPIQGATIPMALEDKDILGSAQTGTGKTLAFSIPLVAKLLSDPKAKALVLTPTRELALQVAQSIAQLLPRDSALKTALLIGGEAMPKQLQQLKSGARIIVGTPGRVIDHTERRTLHLNHINFFVLDEADRMFDMGFGEQIDHIIEGLPEERQTLMFSATFAPNIVKLATKHLRNPERISIDNVASASPLIKQEVLEVREADKFQTLCDQLDDREGSIIVFVKTKIGAEKLAIKLNAQDYGASAIHGDLRQHKRIKVINDFRRGKQRIMVATDVAARGIDVPDIRHVINYDLPQCPDDYIHRIGRTGRAGAEGHAVCFVTPSDTGKWRAIHRMMNPGEKGQDFPRHGGAGHEGRRNKPGMGKKYGSKSGNGGGFFGNRDSDSRRSSKPSFGRGRDDDRRPSYEKPQREAFGASYQGQSRSRDFQRDDRMNDERASQARFARGRDEDRRPSERRSFDERRPSGNRQFDDRRPSERRSFDDRRPSERRSFDDRSAPKGRPSFGAKKSWRDEDRFADRAPDGERRRSFGDRPEKRAGGAVSGKTFFRAEGAARPAGGKAGFKSAGAKAAFKPKRKSDR